MKQATCHPERPHKAKGLCGACSAAAWYAANKEENNLQSRAWYAANKEKRAATGRAYRAAHPESSRAQTRLYRARKLARHAVRTEEEVIQQRAYRVANRARRAATSRTWCAANPERRCGYERLRRARKLGAIGSITSDQWASIKAAYAWRCAYCGKMPASLTQDHVIPLSLGGSHTPANIVPACRACNSSKGARPPTRLPAKRLLI